MQRLVAIAAAVASVKTVVRNQDEISEHKRPAIVVFDADESVAELVERQGHPGGGPALVAMEPELLILAAGTPQTVGSNLNGLRATLVKAVLTDAQLTALTGPNGQVRYVGCSTHLGHGRSMEGTMAIHFSFAYVLKPDAL